MFAIAKLPSDGMIRLFPTTPEGEPGKGFQSVFHRRSILRKGVPTFSTLMETRVAMDNDPESFVMEFDPETRRCAGVWFTKAQQNNGIPIRLHRFHGCYGAFEVRTLT